MRIGIPKEIKVREGRVGLTPAACAECIAAGHELFVQTSAGLLSGFSDAAYEAVGVTVVADAETLYGESGLIVKVKEPQEDDCNYLRSDHLLFCYLHLAAEPTLTRRLCEIGMTAVAFETVEVDGGLPLLTPMSVIAGTVSLQVCACLLHGSEGGKGILLGGLAGTERGRVVILGAGAAGGAAARLAAASGAEVTVFDKRGDRLESMRGMAPNITTRYAFQADIDDAVPEADILIGAVLIPGKRAPHVVSEEVIKRMRPGSVVADISIDQGGCIETSRPTTYDAPTFVQHGVIHFCVTNMPGVVQQTASKALSAALIPFVRQIADPDWRKVACLRGGINIDAGTLTLKL
jgi:alanine dehydrogenase